MPRKTASKPPKAKATKAKAAPKGRKARSATSARAARSTQGTREPMDGPVADESSVAPVADANGGALDVSAAPATSPEPAAAMPDPVASLPTPLSQEMPAKGEQAVSLPEQFLLVALRPGWDDGMLRIRPGAQGAAVAASLLLELALHGGLKVQRGRFVVAADGLPPDLGAVATEVDALGDQSTQVVLERLGRKLPSLVAPHLRRLEAKGVIAVRKGRRMLVVPRTRVEILDATPQSKLQNRLVRVLAGGGNPDARTILLLGLVASSGLLRDVVPAQAYDFNRKRIQALLTGRDTLSYRVDTSIRRVQDLAVQTILEDVKVLQGT